MRKTGARSHPSRRVLLQHTLLLSALGWPALAGANPKPNPKPSAQRAGAWADWDTFAQRFCSPMAGCWPMRKGKPTLRRKATP